MGCSSSQNIKDTQFVGDNPVELKKENENNNMNSPAKTSSCKSTPEVTPVPYIPPVQQTDKNFNNGTQSPSSNSTGSPGKKLTLLQSRNIELTLNIQASYDTCGGTFSRPSTPSLDPHIQIEVPDAFRKKYKVISSLSEKDISSFAFKGNEFQGKVNELDVNIVSSKSDDEPIQNFQSEKNEPCVVLYKGIDRQKKYVIVERTRIDLFENSTIQIEYFDRIDLLRRIDHPCIPSILDVFDTPRDYTVVLQYAVGKSIHEIMETRGPMNNKAAIKAVILALVETLSYLHRMNIAHRNIDTEHLIVSRYNHFSRTKHLRITGLRRLTFIAPPSNNSSPETDSGSVTVSAVPEEYLNIFSAPELSRPNHGLEVDHFALGVVIYSLFSGKTPTEKCNNVSIDALAAPSSLKRIIESLVNVDPAERCSLEKVREYFSKVFLHDEDDHDIYHMNSNSSCEDIEIAHQSGDESDGSRSSVFSFYAGDIGRNNENNLMKLAAHNRSNRD